MSIPVSQFIPSSLPTLMSMHLFFMSVSTSAQSCPTLCDPMDCSPLGSFVHGIFQARTLKWIDISYSGESFQPKDWICVSCISWIWRQILYQLAIWEVLLIRTPALSCEGPTLITWFNLSYPQVLSSKTIKLRVRAFMGHKYSVHNNDL